MTYKTCTPPSKKDKFLEMPVPERKLSECLKISFPYHTSFGGNKHGMCLAADQARADRMLTRPEYRAVVTYCELLTDSINPSECYLAKALNSRFSLEGGMKTVGRIAPIELAESLAPLIAQVYEAVYDKLVSEGL